MTDVTQASEVESTAPGPAPPAPPGSAATSMEDVAAAAGVTRLIVYRHFSSKEDLYRAVLTAVAGRLGEEFARFLSLPQWARHGFATRSILTVARENPDGYRLLMVHAAREPQFEELGLEYRQAGVELARSFVRPVIADPAMTEWAARSIVEYLNNGVLDWLEVGHADRDEEFIERATAGLIALYTAWADPPSGVLGNLAPHMGPSAAPETGAAAP